MSKHVSQLMQSGNLLSELRGKLIHFQCKFDGKIRCEWHAICHGSSTVHSVGKRHSGGNWQMGEILPSDKIFFIHHGIRILRDLDCVELAK